MADHRGYIMTVADPGTICAFCAKITRDTVVEIMYCLWLYDVTEVKFTKWTRLPLSKLGSVRFATTASIVFNHAEIASASVSKHGLKEVRRVLACVLIIT